MKKIFACSNGTEFFTDGESILGTLSEEEAKDFVSNLVINATESGEKMVALAALIFLKAINNSYIQLPKVVKIEVIIII